MVIWLRIPPSVNLTDCFSLHISRQRTTFTRIRGESLNRQNHKLSQIRSIFFICGCMYVCFVNNTWPQISTTKWRLLKFWRSHRFTQPAYLISWNEEGRFVSIAPVLYLFFTSPVFTLPEFSILLFSSSFINPNSDPVITSAE